MYVRDTYVTVEKKGKEKKKESRVIPSVYISRAVQMSYDLFYSMYKYVLCKFMQDDFPELGLVLCLLVSIRTLAVLYNWVA